MPLKQVIRVPDEPILIYEYEGGVDAACINAAMSDSMPLALGIGGNIFIVTDMTKATTSFAEMMGMLRWSGDISRHAPLPVPIKITFAFIGTDAMLRTFVNNVGLHQFGGIKGLMFTTREDALTSIRKMVSGEIAIPHEASR